MTRRWAAAAAETESSSQQVETLTSKNKRTSWENIDKNVTNIHWMRSSVDSSHPFLHPSSLPHRILLCFVRHSSHLCLHLFIFTFIPISSFASPPPYPTPPPHLLSPCPSLLSPISPLLFSSAHSFPPITPFIWILFLILLRIISSFPSSSFHLFISGYSYFFSSSSIHPSILPPSFFPSLSIFLLRLISSPPVFILASSDDDIMTWNMTQRRRWCCAKHDSWCSAQLERHEQHHPSIVTIRERRHVTFLLALHEYPGPRTYMHI